MTSMNRRTALTVLAASPLVMSQALPAAEKAGVSGVTVGRCGVMDV